MMNDVFKNTLDTLLQSEKVSLWPLDDFQGFNDDLSEWSATTRETGNENSYTVESSILGSLGYLISKEGGETAENEFIEYINDRIISNRYSQSGVTNIAVLLSRVDWSEARIRDAEVLVNIPKDKITKAIKDLITEYNKLEWPSKYRTSEKSTFRVLDWETMFRYFDYLPDFHNPFMPLLNLMEQVHMRLDEEEISYLQDKVAVGYLFESWSRYRSKTRFYGNELNLIKSIKAGRMPPELVTALLFGSYKDYVPKMGKTIRWLMKNVWEDCGVYIMNRVYSKRLLSKELSVELSKIINDEMINRFESNWSICKDRFIGLKWTSDWEAFAGWALNAEFQVNPEISEKVFNEMATQWNEIREDRRKRIVDHIYSNTSSGPNNWFINPLEENAQKTINLIAYAFLKCKNNVWQAIFSGFKKDIHQAKSLLFTSSARFYGTEIYEEWLLIIIGMISYDGEDSNHRVNLIVTQVLKDLMPFVRATENTWDIWDYSNESPVRDKNLYLINGYLRELRDNKYSQELKTRWKDLATTEWPWMVKKANS